MSDEMKKCLFCIGLLFWKTWFYEVKAIQFSLQTFLKGVKIGHLIKIMVNRSVQLFNGPMVLFNGYILQSKRSKYWTVPLNGNEA